LFTLVGIAGEDDVDAPDLLPPEQQTSVPNEPKGGGDGRLNGGQVHAPHRAAARRDGKLQSNPTKPPLGPETSAALRDRLLGELNEFISSDDAALWAHRSLVEKNQLTAADAQRVEEAFQARLASFAMPGADEPRSPGGVAQPLTMHGNDPDKKPKTKSRSKAIDKCVLALPEPRRIRDRDHVRYVAKQPCLVCGRQPSDAHHLRFAQSRAIGRKVSDEFTVPLCRGHHREVHRCGDEAAWWRKIGVDPTVAARALWLETHPMPTDLDKFFVNGVDAPAAHSTESANPKRDRRVGGRRTSRKSKQVEVTVPHGNV
jgi:hypothetical protein